MNLLKSIRNVSERRMRTEAMPHSIVLLMRKPFFLDEDALREPTGRAFGGPYNDLA